MVYFTHLDEVLGDISLAFGLWNIPLHTAWAHEVRHMYCIYFCFVCSFLYSFIHSFVYLFTRILNHSITHSPCMYYISHLFIAVVGLHDFCCLYWVRVHPHWWQTKHPLRLRLLQWHNDLYTYTHQKPQHTIISNIFHVWPPGEWDVVTNETVWQLRPFQDWLWKGNFNLRISSYNYDTHALFP